MKKAIIGTAVLALALLGYACKNDDENPITTGSTPVQLAATLTNSGGFGGSTTSTGTGTFLGNVSQPASASSAQSSNVLSYTVTFAGISPTAISLDPVSTSTTSGSSSYSNSILLAGAFPSTTTTPGSGTTTTPGSGTSTTPGSGTTTTPGSGTTTTPGSGTSTTPGSGTAVSLISPITGTVSMSQSRADSLSRGLYRLTIRSTAYPNGEIGGTVQVR